MPSRGMSNSSNDTIAVENDKREEKDPRPLYAPVHYLDLEPLLARQKHRRRWLGLDPQRPLKPHERGAEKFLWSRVRSTLQEPFSEFLGTFVLATFYMGGIAQASLSAGISTAPGGYGYGAFQSVPWVTGIGVMIGIYVAGDSGAYLNPAITLANCAFRGLPWRQLPITIFAQFMGAFVGAAVVYGNYVAAIDWYSGHGNRIVPPTSKYTASIFATYPSSFTPRSTQLIQIITPTALMTLAVSALKDDYNNGSSSRGGNLFPLGMFFLFYGLGTAFGWETSGATNPALDFGGRLFSNCVGYPKEVWSTSGYYFWMPLFLPFGGACLGAFLYDIFVYTGPSPVNSSWLGFGKLFNPQEQQENKEDREEQRDDSDNDAV